MSLRLFFYRLIPLFLALPLLSACGGGGSSSESSTSSVATQAVKGYVEDGPIAGAIVELRYFDTAENGYVTAYFCGASGRGECLSPPTDVNGGFSFTVNAFANLPELVVFARGGVDQMTGETFSELPMRSALKLFPGQSTAVTVSPLTTLMTGEIERGATPGEAQQRIRDWLKLPADLGLALRPSESQKGLQPIALLLTHLAKERAGSADPFCELKSASAGPLLDDSGEISSAALTALVAGGKAEHFRDLYQKLHESRPGEMGGVYRKQAMKQALLGVFSELFAGEEGFNADEPLYLANLELVGEQILSAAKGRPFPLDDIVPSRLARYVAFVYDLSSYQVLLQDSASFADQLVRNDENGALVALADDPKIRFLADLETRYSVEVPVRLSRIRSDLEKEAKKEGLTIQEDYLEDPKKLLAAYYYRSDLSPFHEAEQLIAGVNSAEVNDAIMLEVVRAKAQAGLQAEVEKLLKGSAIIQSEYRAHAWRAYGDALRGFGQIEEAVTALKEAETLYRKVIDSKGVADIEGSDAENLQYLSRSYAKAGDLISADRVTNYFLSLSRYLTALSTHGKLFVAVRDLAERYLEDDDRNAARELAAVLYDLALDTPPNENSGFSYYKIKTFHLVETATLYADLGDDDKVWELYTRIEQLRRNDGLENLTLNETWVYVDDMVRNLYIAGYAPEAFALANSIPDSYEDYKGAIKIGKTYQERALKEVATFISLEEGNEAAFSFLEEHFPSDRDKIEVLTYYALNKRRAYIAQSHIDRRQLVDARAALDRARVLLDGLEETIEVNVYLYLVNYGYAKLADLYRHAEAPQQAAELLATARTIAAGIEDAHWKSLALQSVAEAYQEIGDVLSATEVMNQILVLLVETESFSREKYRMSAYRKVLGIYPSMPDEQLWQDALTRVRALFTESESYADTDHDDLADLEAEHLIRAACFLADLATRSLPITAEIYRSQALALLDEAKDVSDQIYVEKTRYDRYFGDADGFDLVGGYARAGGFAAAKLVAEAIPYREKRHDALQGLAETYCAQDAFPDTLVARVDTDGDGAPDFFSPLAGAEEIADSELAVDEDSDGDGIPDLEDSRPLYPDSPTRRN